MKKFEQIREVLGKHRNELRQRYHVRRLGIFGSYVRNEQREKSDLDILVDFEKPIGLFKFLDLEEYLEKLVKRKIDLVSRTALKPYIGRAILNEVVFV